MPRQISIAFQTDKPASQYIALARLVDQYNFDSVSVYCDAPYHPSYAPLMLMAQHIQRARLGPAAVSPSRVHPIDIAAQSALLAELAAGGVYIGLARGSWLEAHGISEDQPPIEAMRDAVNIIRYLLSGGTGGYDGKVYRLAEHVSAPYPLPASDIPIMIGTWGRKLGALAGEIADEVKIGGSANPDVVPVIRGYVAEGERKTGRDEGTVKIAIGAVTVVDEDRQRARAAVRRDVAMYLPVVARLDPTVQLEPELLERLQRHVNLGETQAAANLISDDLLNRFAFAGSAADIIEHAECLFEAGVNRIEFGTPHGITAENGIRILGEQVIPALRSWRR